MSNRFNYSWSDSLQRCEKAWSIRQFPKRILQIVQEAAWAQLGQETAENLKAAADSSMTLLSLVGGKDIPQVLDDAAMMIESLSKAVGS